MRATVSAVLLSSAELMTCCSIYVFISFSKNDQKRELICLVLESTFILNSPPHKPLYYQSPDEDVEKNTRVCGSGLSFGKKRILFLHHELCSNETEAQNIYFLLFFFIFIV